MAGGDSSSIKPHIDVIKVQTIAGRTSTLLYVQSCRDEPDLKHSKVFVVVFWWSLQLASAPGGENPTHTSVGASRLMKAMLLRHILLKKAGQTGFMMRCSIRIRSSVRCWEEENKQPDTGRGINGRTKEQTGLKSKNVLQNLT